MKIELRLPERLEARFVPRTYDIELDDVGSLFIDICEFLVEQIQGLEERRALFSVGGFGQDRWPVYVWTDLAILLEQLPFALSAINAGRGFGLDFYEQGVERLIELVPEGDRYVATCRSHGDWQPHPAVEHIDRPALIAMMMAVRTEFLRFLTANCEQLLPHPWIQTWIQATAAPRRKPPPGRR